MFIFITLQSQSRPTEVLPLFESGAKAALKLFLSKEGAERVNDTNIPNFQVILTSAESTQSLRNLTAEHVNKLLKVPGIVINCSRLQVKATAISIRCSNCGSTQVSDKF